MSPTSVLRVPKEVSASKFVNGKELLKMPISQLVKKR